MTDTAKPSGNESELLKHRLEYWHKRLDQTLQHTQTATKLIYMADGAVLAFVYFWLKALGITRVAIGTTAFPLFLLAVMNYFHAGFIRSQQSWFNGFDRVLRELLSQKAITHTLAPTRLRFPESSHRCIYFIHLAMSVALLVVSILMLLYGIGLFPDLPTPPIQK